MSYPRAGETALTFFALGVLLGLLWGLAGCNPPEQNCILVPAPTMTTAGAAP